MVDAEKSNGFKSTRMQFGIYTYDKECAFRQQETLDLSMGLWVVKGVHGLNEETGRFPVREKGLSF